MSMKSLDTLYEQYNLLVDKFHDCAEQEFTTNLLQYGIKEEYYNLVDKAVGLLVNFYDKYLMSPQIEQAIINRLEDDRSENVKFCLLMDVLRCYDGLGHPTSFITPEGTAMMILLSKVLGVGEIQSYKQLESVDSARLSLIDIIPYIDECSEELGNRYSLLLSSILDPISQETDRLYRLLLYNLCKRIAEVDGVISLAEKEWLNEIALLNDDNPDNDIDVSGI